MITSRSKRSTAGNRLKALLDQELEKDEIFTEVENDVDFQANEDADGVDIVDSDFDRDSDDDQAAVEDESEGEREIVRAEKEVKAKRRAATKVMGIVKRPAPARATGEAKRRRISFAPDTLTSTSSATGTVVEGKRRSSARSATVQSKRDVESRLEEAEQRRATQPTRAPAKKREKLTQDALIAEALEVEEENRESLRRFLEQEEERRRKQRVRKERIVGPFVRWMSVGLKVKRPVVEEVVVVEKDKEADERALLPAPQQMVSENAAMAMESSEQEPATTVSPPAPPTPTIPLTSTSALTLDPVLQARKEAANHRTTTTSSPSKPTPSTEGYELQSRTLLSVERMPEDWEWLDEFSTLLGSHVDWSSYPYVPSRNRPLKPRQSICPITGLPALYRDPRTGIPYANSHAYKVITQVLKGKFWWTGGHYSQPEEVGKGKKNAAVAAKVASGAVPVQMGIYVDDEDEKGPNDVWLKSKQNLPTPAPTLTHTRTTNSTPSIQEAPAKKDKTKPGFDVVLTNAIAPGDEKALLAQALSLPAGSTRSGRRVHRS